jgi:hypothetical protein
MALCASTLYAFSYLAMSNKKRVEETKEGTKIFLKEELKLELSNGKTEVID